MKAHGNLSGASNLAVLDHLNRRTHGLPLQRRWVLCLSMGPGACLEGLVLRPPRKLLPELGTRGAFELDPASLERLHAAPKERLRLSDSSPQRPRPTGSSAQHAPRSSLHRSCHSCITITLTL